MGDADCPGDRLWSAHRSGRRSFLAL